MQHRWNGIHMIGSTIRPAWGSQGFFIINFKTPAPFPRPKDSSLDVSGHAAHLGGFALFLACICWVVLTVKPSQP